MAVVGEQFEKYVSDQINIRQEIHGKENRTIDDLRYLNSKTAWVKLASGIKIEGEERIKNLKWNGISQGTDLAKKYVLFGGVSKKNDTTVLEQFGGFDLNSSYQPYNINAKQQTTNLDFGFVPPPGIESVEVKNMNRGSIKKATITLKAYSRDQFDILDVLYMRLGYTVLLEWGWSHYLNNSGQVEEMGYTLIEDPNGFFSDDYKSHLQFLPKIRGYRESKQGNYDGLLAKVSNFNWTFNPDGSYGITLTLISLGDVIESLKTNVSPKLTDGDPTKKPKDILSEYLSIWKSAGKGGGAIYYYLNGGTKIGNYLEGVTSETEDSKDFTSLLADAENISISIANIIKDFEEDSFIITEIGIYDAYKILLKKEIQLPSGNEKGDAARIVYKYVDLIKDNGSRTNGFVKAKLTLAGGGITNQNNVIYFNYTTGKEENESEQDNNVGYYMRLGHLLDKVQEYCIPKTKDTTSPIIKLKTEGSRMLYYPNQISFDPRICVVRGEIDGKKVFTELKTWTNETFGNAFTMNIYVSFSTIQSAIDGNLDERGDLALVSFIQAICTDLNKALGGVNNLEPVVDEDINQLEIIDGSLLSDNITLIPYKLELFGYNPEFKSSNFVRNVDLKTQITPEYATMVTIGATAGGYVKGTENTMFSKWNKGLIDRFKEKYIPPSPSTSTSSTTDEEEPKTNYIKYLKSEDSILGYDSNKNLDVNAIDNNLSVVTEYYKYLNAIAQQNDEKFSSTTNGFIPFNLGITMDGISGIKIYNKLNVSTRFLPSNYPDTLHFIIKGVSHKISNQDWETSLETVVVPNSSVSNPS
jgi:hypothetical protein